MSGAPPSKQKLEPSTQGQTPQPSVLDRSVSEVPQRSAAVEAPRCIDVATHGGATANENIPDLFELWFRGPRPDPSFEMRVRLLREENSLLRKGCIKATLARIFPPSEPSESKRKRLSQLPPPTANQSQAIELALDEVDEGFQRHHVLIENILGWSAADVDVLNALGAVIDHTDSDFYIGLCGSPAARYLYEDVGHRLKWRYMHVLVGTEARRAADIERALIDRWLGKPRCVNRRRGGGGSGPAGCVGFVYVCVGALEF